MPKQQHHPYDIKTYYKGANRDLDPELLGSTNKGEYIDSVNMRPNSNDGDRGAMEKIDGEELLYANQSPYCIYGTSAPLAGTWVCIGAIDVNRHIVEFWTDSSTTSPSDPLIRIDGDVVLQSSKFPISVDHPLQIAKNESCVGGEVYITDFKSTPMYFNIQVLIDNKCTQKYFSSFDLSENQIILQTPPDHPVFVELLTAGNGANVIPGAQVVTGGGGTTMLAGTYQYRIRYVSETGERTKLSVATPPIPAPEIVSSSSNQYPYSKTRGEFNGSLSSYTIKIRFRVNNTENYDFIEVVRVSYNSLQGVAGIGSTDVVAKIQLEADEVSVYDFIDDGTESLEVVADEELTDVMKVISRAKAVRYFNQRLFFMNVEYESRDVEKAGVTFKQSSKGNELYPTVDNMGTAGHRDPWNFVNYKSYMRGEKYGFAVVFYDSTGERTFALPIPNAEDFQMPNRRDIPKADALASVRNGDGWQRTVWAATVNGYHPAPDGLDANNTFEVFDLSEGIAKDDVCTFRNISNKGSKDSADQILAWCADGQSPKDANSIGPKPFTPIKPSDTDVTGHNMVINTIVDKDSSTSYSYPNYKPYGFAPRYFSMGAILQGMENIPSWATAMAIVRTEPAGRVISQGLGFYSLYGGKLNNIGTNRTANKNNKSLWFHSSDLSRGFADSSDMVGNSLQFASPLGFFSEFWSADRQDNYRDTKIDMISYVRILEERGDITGRYINSGDNSYQVGGSATFGGIGKDGYVAYGKWRNKFSNVSHFWIPTSGFTIAPDLSNYDYAVSGVGNRLDMNVTAFSAKSEGRGTYYELSMQTSGNWGDLYRTTDALQNYDFSDGEVKDWHEPMYITNVVNKFANVPNQNISEYMETGNFLKFDAVIGKGNGIDSQDFYLVDERWEDCIPDPRTPTATLETLDLFIYIKTTTGVTLKYLNVTYKTVTEISTISAALNSVGSYVHNGVTINGIYRHLDVYSNERLWKITIDNNDYFDNAPVSKSEVRVKYDSTKPIRFYGGDVTISENVFSPVDRQTDDGKTPNDIDSDDAVVFPLNVPFPYYGFGINPRIYQHQGGSLGNNVMDRYEFNLEAVRQMVAMYTCENRGDWSFIVNAADSDYQSQSFPLVNYIMKPMKWNPNQTWDSNEMFDMANDYPELDDGGNPNSNCGLGGFKFSPLINYNYSHKPVAQMHFGTPKVGFRDDTYFCTRILWSEKRGVNQLDSPGIKTFREQSRFDISDDQGEIKFAWDAVTGKGSNLYAITATGMCLLMTDKRVLSDANSNQLAIIGTDASQVILEQIWLTKDIGMDSEMWRSAAGFDNTLYFANYNSVYMLQEDNALDIGRLNYHSKLSKDMLNGLSLGYTDHVAGGYDRLNNEYWLNYKRKATDKTYSASEDFSIIDDGASYGTPNVSVAEGSILTVTASKTVSAYLATITPSYALTARNISICLTDSSSDVVVKVPSPVTSGFDTLVTINAGECYCFKGFLDTLTGGTYGGAAPWLPTGQSRDIIKYEPGADVSSIKLGQDITLSFFDRGTNTNVVQNFTVLFIIVDASGSTIVLDTDSLGLISLLNNGDSITVSTGFVRWVSELCDKPAAGSTFSYSVANKSWIGKYDYSFDKFVSVDTRTYGLRELLTYELGIGYKINGTNIEASVMQVSAQKQMWGKEFIRIRIASDNKPTKVNFYAVPDGDLLASLDEAIQGQYYLKNYRGYEQYIPRKQEGEKHRIQGRSLIFKIVHSKPEPFKVVDAAVQYKLIK